MKTCGNCKYVSGHPGGMQIISGLCYCGRLSHDDFAVIADKLTPGFIVQYCPLSLTAETDCKHYVPK